MFWTALLEWCRSQRWQKRMRKIWKLSGATTMTCGTGPLWRYRAQPSWQRHLLTTLPWHLMQKLPLSHFLLAGCRRSHRTPCGCPVCGFALAGWVVPPVHERGGEAEPGKTKKKLNATLHKVRLWNLALSLINHLNASVSHDQWNCSSSHMLACPSVNAFNNGSLQSVQLLNWHNPKWWGTEGLPACSGNGGMKFWTERKECKDLLHPPTMNLKSKSRVISVQEKYKGAVISHSVVWKWVNIANSQAHQRAWVWAGAPLSFN